MGEYRGGINIHTGTLAHSASKIATSQLPEGLQRRMPPGFD